MKRLKWEKAGSGAQGEMSPLDQAGNEREARRGRSLAVWFRKEGALDLLPEVGACGSLLTLGSERTGLRSQGVAPL